MNDLRKAAQIAVEALEADPDDMVEVTKDHWEYKREQAWKILRAALAQPDRGPLTLQEVDAIWFTKTDMESVVRAVERAHGIE